MKKIIYALLVFLGMHTGLIAEEYYRNFPLSSAYVERVFNDNKGLAAFPLGAIEAYGKLYDVATDSFTKQWWSRLITSIAEMPLSFWYAHSIFIPFHEFGHGRAIKALGGDYTFSTLGYGRVLGSGIKSYWELSAWRLVTPPFFFPGDGIASTSGAIQKNVSEKYYNFVGKDPGVSIIQTSAGLNNQSFLAKRLAQNLYDSGSHFTGFQHYFGNKISGLVYSRMDRNMDKSDDMLMNNSSDIGQILNAYSAKGYNVTHKDIEFQSLLSIVSGTTASFIKGYYNYIVHGQSIVRPLEVYSVRIPDINSYINARGLSLEIVSGYRWSDTLYFDVAYEFVWKGDSAHEVSTGMHMNLAAFAPVLNEMWIEPEIIISKALAGSFAVRYAPFSRPSDNFWHRFSYFADLTLHNGFTLQGERNSPNLHTASALALSGFLGLNVRY